MRERSAVQCVPLQTSLTTPAKRSFNNRQNPSRSTPPHDHRFGRAARSAPPFGDGHAEGVLALRLDLDVDVAGVDEGGLKEAGDHAGIVRGPAVRIDGTDEGEGIGGIYLPRLTGRFCRIDIHRSREQGGRDWPS